MTRRFFLALWAFLAARVTLVRTRSSRPQAGATSWPPSAIAGNWHLVDEAADETNLPTHRVDLRFELTGPELRGVVLSRVNGAEMLALPDVSFDGRVLRYRMGVLTPDGQPMPEMVMRVSGSVLLGRWYQQGAPAGPALKLVRSPGVIW